MLPVVFGIELYPFVALRIESIATSPALTSFACLFRRSDPSFGLVDITSSSTNNITHFGI